MGTARPGGQGRLRRQTATQPRCRPRLPSGRFVGPAPDEHLQARACVALSDLIRRIGLGAEPRVKPASLTAFAGVRIFGDTGKIEDVARGLGLRSLDRAADLVGYDWAQLAPEQQAADA
ncbi:hypothetical protein [Streptomyces sp. NPDC057381]|uniref:hypothetical protein n=1 Tax=Streptomyces sp. NPDC057381 TaxID=3346111 RepID=UPI0036328664